MARIIYARTAAKALTKLHTQTRADLIEKLEIFAATGTGDVKRLVARPGYRLRSGDYRLIFDIERDTFVVRAAGHRRDVYR